MRTPRGRVATRNAYLHFGLQYPENNKTNGRDTDGNNNSTADLFEHT
jgi:hypothetical protein